MIQLSGEARAFEQRLFGVMAIVALAITFAGFAPTYYLGSVLDAPPLTPWVHLHGAVFTLWVLLFVLQVSLVGRGRQALHRRLGGVGAVLAMAMLLSGVSTAILSARAAYVSTSGESPLIFLALPLFVIVAFTVLVGWGLLRRREPAIHKRFMMTAMIAILSPAIARLPLAFIKSGGPPAFFGLTDLLWAICVVLDSLTRRQVHSAWLWAGAVLIGFQMACLATAHSSGWLTLARWLIG